MTRPSHIAWKRFVSPRLGPVTHSNEHRSPIGIPFHIITGIGRDDNAERILGAGGAICRRRAYESALGETMERLAISRASNIVRAARVSDLSDSVVEPVSIVHYLDDVYASGIPELRRYNVNDHIEWILGESLSTKAPTWLPAFSVFKRLRSTLRPPDLPVSTGAAVSDSRNGAILAGLLEVIERDAFMIHWENRWPGEPAQSASTIAAFPSLKVANLQISLSRLQTDVRGVYVALAVLEDPSGKLADFALGAAARLSWEAAAYRALEEALLTMSWMALTSRRGDQEELRHLEAEMRGLPKPEDHARLYASWGYAPRAAFLRSPVNSCGAFIKTDDLNSSMGLECVVSSLVSIGYDPVFVELGTPEVRKNGLHAVRVIVPGFVPLGRGLIARPLANERLTRVPKQFGQPDLAPNFNPDPHPFP